MVLRRRRRHAAASTYTATPRRLPVVRRLPLVRHERYLSTFRAFFLVLLRYL
jgi:hypothetical protein